MTDLPVDTVRLAEPHPRGSTEQSTSFARSTASMTAATAVSRLTGFIRIVVVAAVLGTTFLGNVYQSANTVPNLMFELVAAGVLQAVLIPTLVTLLDRGDRSEAEHVAGSVLGLTCAGLAVIAVVGIVAAPLVARGLFGGVHDPVVRANEIRLGTVFLWFFLPQVVMYGVGLVATSILNAHDRFALPAFAPALNNVVVTVSYGLFWLLRGSEEPSLHLARVEVLALAGGTTLGVLAFCALPAAAVLRSDFRLRPNLDRRHPDVRRIGRLGAWAALFLAATQVLLVVVLVLANRVEGGVVAYQVGFAFFLLPHALFALPVLTASFPALSRQAAAHDSAGFSHSVERGTRAIAYFVLPAAAALTALAALLARSVLFGRTGPAGAAQVAGVLVGFAPGLLGYGMFLFLSRVHYARNDTKTPALVNVVVSVAGAIAMVAAFRAVHGTLRVPALALVHSATYTAGAVVLYQLVCRRLPDDDRPRVLRSIAAPAVAAVVAGMAMWAIAQVSSPDGRLATLVAAVVAGVLGGVLFVAVTAMLGGPRPRALIATLREDRRG